jgi:carbon storage regulator
MLVLSRKETQRIRVGDSVVVTIVKVSGDKVRVGIEAPSDMLVLRDELEPWDTIKSPVEPAAAVFPPPAASMAASLAGVA